MRRAIAAMLPAVLVAAAVAQSAANPVESVTVTGDRSPAAIGGFVETFVAPARLTGKITRWEEGICPVAVGLKPGFTNFVLQRVKELAVAAGAPVDDGPSCKPNIEIVFTTRPQALIDNIRKEQSGGFLGYYDNAAQLDRLATVTHPIQAWYTTETKDLRGKTEIDTARRVGIGIVVPCGDCPGGSVYLPNATRWRTEGSRLGNGMRSGFYHIIIVADPAKLVDYEMGAVADYIAMLALAQLQTLDSCQQLPSIMNLLAPGCARITSATTDNDTAYLRGLYKMSPGRSLRNQQDDIAYQMEKSLEGR